MKLITDIEAATRAPTAAAAAQNKIIIKKIASILTMDMILLVNYNNFAYSSHTEWTVLIVLYPS